MINQDDIEMLVVAIFADCRTLPTSQERRDMFLRGLRHRYEDIYPHLFLSRYEEFLKILVYQVHVDVVLSRAINETTMSPGIDEYYTEYRSNPVEAYGSFSFKRAAHSSVIDEILNAMFGEDYPELRYLKKYFIRFGWTDSSFIPTLAALPRMHIPSLMRDVAKHSK
ncbi:hypothetical protein CVT26_004894, partial [Gymnopilus dilepis]